TQQSAETAKVVAQEYTQTDLSGFDLIYSIQSDSKLVGGPSAGAALTVATIAAIQQKNIRTDAAITGTIEADGSIGPIGGVIEKAQAVAASGKILFLIPKGQGKVIIYQPKFVVEQRGRFQIQRTTYETKELDLIAYAKGDLNLEVREVTTIDDAVKALLQ
ncbi:MAG: S16 family serine protease, partial [Candidatus Diapherotrites archaeon]|nr:S16 family serine protease [Candidatus Diapherotrites archaeon]